MDKLAIGTRERIDYLLDYLTEAWRRLPEVEQSIDGWDLIQQIDYVEEWTPKLEQGEILQQLVASSQASEAQRARYATLKRLMDQNRPILDRLRAS